MYFWRSKPDKTNSGRQGTHEKIHHPYLTYVDHKLPSGAGI